MNPFSGHLLDLKNIDKPTGYDTIPKRLAAEAERALAGKPETTVDLTSRTPLAEWAKKKRLAKIAAKSRRRNRK